MRPFVRGSGCVLTAAFLVLLSVSCGRTERAEATIEFWTLQLSPAFDDYINGIIADFEIQHPGVRVVWTDVPFEGITQKYLSSIAAGTPPDVINLPADFVAKYARMNILAPLGTLVSDSILGAFLPSAMEPLRIRSGTYSIPWYLATKITIYNKAEMANAGFSPDSVPKTFGELLELAVRFYRETGRHFFFYNLAVDSYLVQVLASEGIPMVSEDGSRATFYSPEAVQIIEEWVATFRMGALPRESVQSGHRGAIESYQSGSVALFIGAPQFLRIIRENAPDIYRETAVAPSVVGSTGVAELDVMALGISLSSHNLPLAAAFAVHVTNAANQMEFARRVPVYPSIISALNDPFFIETDTSLESRARIIGARQLQSARVLKPALSEYPRLQEIFKTYILKACLGTMSVDEALRTAAQKWDAVLAEKHE